MTTFYIPKSLNILTFKIEWLYFFKGNLTPSVTTLYIIVIALSPSHVFVSNKLTKIICIAPAPLRQYYTFLPPDAKSLRTDSVVILKICVCVRVSVSSRLSLLFFIPHHSYLIPLHLSCRSCFSSSHVGHAHTVLCAYLSPCARTDDLSLMCASSYVFGCTRRENPWAPTHESFCRPPRCESSRLPSIRARGTP